MANISSKTTIESFNKPDVSLVISGYPEESGSGSTNHGIAWYTKESIEPLAKNYGMRFVVLAEKNGHNEPRLYQNGKILRLRAFDHKHPTLFPRILRYLMRFNRIKNVYVHSEFCANGGIQNFLLLNPFLFLIKLFGKKITFFSHNVITNFDTIGTHLNVNSKAKLAFYNTGIKIYYWMLGHIIDRMVVLDEAMYGRITQFISKEKVVLAPLPVRKRTLTISKKQAKAVLNIPQKNFVLLYFGFITWYKGADWLVETMRTLKKKGYKEVTVILAGGPAHSLKDKQYYQAFYAHLLETAAKIEGVRVTGFVKEHDIPTYFAASDAIVLPYQGLIGGSGAMNHAMAFGKPFIVSDKMKEVWNGTDASEILSKHKLTIADVTFAHTASDFERMLKRLSTSTSSLHALTRVSTSLAQARAAEKLHTQEALSIYGRSDVHAHHPLTSRVTMAVR